MIFPVLRKAGFSHLEVVDRGDVDPKHSVLEDIVAESQANDIKIPNWHLVMESPFKKNGETLRTIFVNDGVIFMVIEGFVISTELS
jgi:hypothetical protein